MTTTQSSVEPTSAGQLESTDLPELLRDTIGKAVVAGATDVHVDMWRDKGVLRFRIHGAVQRQDEMGAEGARRLINQVKVASALDIDNTASPQEGHMRWRSGDEVRDVRVTVIPTAPSHEAIHLRLLATAEERLGLKDLGMSDEQLEMVRGYFQQPHGLMLLAGLNGAGKTTTLYALLADHAEQDSVIVSVEDPAEFDLPDVRQVEADEAQGLPMAEALRTILRMDPDVMALGEIRDNDSAQLAARAALAGRAMLATIHGSDSAAAIEALHFLGVPYYVLAGGLRVVVAQGLVRELCDACKRERKSSDEEEGLFKEHGLKSPKRVYEAVGCDKCSGLGYRGRLAAFEVNPISHDDRVWLAKAPRQAEVRQRFAERGEGTLGQQALRFAIDGRTTVAEACQLC